MRQSFTERVRGAAKQLSSEIPNFEASDLGERLGIQRYEDMAKLRQVIQELCKSGEIERQSKGVYRYVGKPEGKPTRQLVMWRLLRMRKIVSIEDLQLIAGVSADYAKEWLRDLVKTNIVRKQEGGKYQLVKDIIDMPHNQEKTERLRRIRKLKKEGLSIIETIQHSMRLDIDVLDSLAEAIRTIIPDVITIDDYVTSMGDEDEKSSDRKP